LTVSFSVMFAFQSLADEKESKKRGFATGIFASKSGKVHINVDKYETQRTTVAVINKSGRQMFYEVLRKNVNKYRIALDVSDLPIGTYRIEISSEKGKQIENFEVTGEKVERKVSIQKDSLPPATVKTGGVKMIPVKTPYGTFKVWTKRIGDNPKIKILLLAGGPGLSHEYLEVFENFFPKEGIEFIYYDQLGTGYSDKPHNDKLFDLQRSVDELEQVRSALDLNQDNLYLWGHSWGGILAMEYALKYQKNLKSLIISNMVSSAAAYNRYVNGVLARQMPRSVLDSVRTLERAKDFSNPRYTQLLLEHFYPKYICRLPVQDWPEPFIRSFVNINHNYYTSMQGPSEFGISGKLSDWDREKDLSKITIPTLVIGSKYDTMSPQHMEWMRRELKQGEFLFCPNGSHLSFYDDQQVYMTGLIRYIKAVHLSSSF
jgi:proline iminopeptidase